jgi:hypothetical protein
MQWRGRKGEKGETGDGKCGQQHDRAEERGQRQWQLAVQGGTSKGIGGGGKEGGGGGASFVGWGCMQMTTCLALAGEGGAGRVNLIRSTGP